MRSVSFVRDAQEAQQFRETVKQRRCPFCQLIGFLICHGYLRGFSPDCPEGSDSAEDALRGWRFYCSNRGRRQGCGHTFSVLLSRCLRRRQNIY